MNKIKSVLIIDDNSMDIFICHRLLESYGVANVISFNNADSALSYLKDTNIIYQVILVDIYMPKIDGFEFIDKFFELELQKNQGNIYFLTASLNPSDKERATKRSVDLIEKPMTLEKYLELQ
jgi:CheY-like chemotaxis protein